MEHTTLAKKLNVAVIQNFQDLNAMVRNYKQNENDEMITLKIMNELSPTLLNNESFINYLISIILDDTDDKISLLDQYKNELTPENKENIFIAKAIIDFHGYERHSLNDVSYSSDDTYLAIPEKLRNSKEFIISAHAIDPKFFLINKNIKKVFNLNTINEVQNNPKYVSEIVSDWVNYDGATLILLLTHIDNITEESMLTCLDDKTYGVFKRKDVIKKFKNNEKIINEMNKVSYVENSPFKSILEVINPKLMVKDLNEWKELINKYIA